MKMDAPLRRRYEMVARAQSATATGERILDVAVEAFWELPREPVSLNDVAQRAGVSVQTVIRRFGGRDGLFAAAAEREIERTRGQRDQAPAGDVRGAVRVLVEHYEAWGERVALLLAEEQRSAELRELAERGRVLHREWCARVFAATLQRLAGAERRRRLAQLVAVCDFYMWKLLRRDAQLSRRQTELALVELLVPILKDA
jgi:AcrR family transcriptional regulator